MTEQPDLLRGNNETGNKKTRWDKKTDHRKQNRMQETTEEDRKQDRIQEVTGQQMGQRTSSSVLQDSLNQ